jgi:putative ABC transport system permease protein
MKFLRRFRQQHILSEELASHLEELTDELVTSGFSKQDARDEARRQFGNQTALLETSREVWRFAWLDALLRELRFAWRMAKRQPWTVAAAVLSIGIGVGANTAVTSVLDSVLLNPLGIKNASRIVAATVHIKKLEMMGAQTSGAELRDLQSAPDVFAEAAATEGRAWTMGAGDHPQRLLGTAVTSGFFKIFGENLELGHGFVGQNPNQLILSYGLWATSYGQNSGVLGQKVILNGEPYEVVGVAPADFHFPAKAQAWVPLILTPDHYIRGNNMSLNLFARLSNGVSWRQAQQQVDHRLSIDSIPDDIQLKNLGYGIDVQPIARRVAGDLRLPLLLLWSAATLLLLAACANVAGLLLARAGGRRKEMAIRIAVGAGRGQILRQLLIESLLLAFAGGTAGLLLAYVGLNVLRREPLPFHSLLAFMGLNHRMLSYGFAVALSSSLIFGLVPALELVREHSGSLVRSRRKWFQNIYIVGQVSAAMLLLVVTGLLLKSMKAVESLSPGFDTKDISTAFLIKPAQNLPAFYDQLLSRLQATPGVEAASFAFTIPFAADGDAPTSMFSIKGRQHLPGQPEWHAEAYQVTAGYLDTLKLPLLRGRFIRDSDTPESRKVCVIDASLAERFFPSQDPIGQEIAIYGGWAQIVGVVASMRDASLEKPSLPVVYYALKQVPYFPVVGVMVRSRIPAAGIIRAAVAKANPAVPVFDLNTMQQRIYASEATRSVMALMVAAFAAISILLAAIGIHGVISQVVSQRTSEIGVRMALGASSSEIFCRYTRQGLLLSMAGIAIGLCAALACGGWLRGFLYQVQPLDPITLAFGVLAVLVVSATAVAAPAWRASHIDPQTALRNE